MRYNASLTTVTGFYNMSKKQTLRDVQKADTRRRLLDAAALVFSREGFTESTVKKITTEAGASRPTFYLHFKDKEAVLDELVADYRLRVQAFMEGFPGREPSVEELEQWLYDAGGFIEQESLLSSVLTQVIGLASPSGVSYGMDALNVWIEGLAANSPLFAAVFHGTGDDAVVQAQGRILAIQVVWAATNAQRNSDDGVAKETVRLTARALHEFMHRGAAGGAE